MAGFLRALGAIVLLAGLALGTAAGWAFVRDTRFHEVAAAYARHPDHALFQADYLAAAVRHYGLLAAIGVGLLGGLSLGGMLLALGEILRRLPRR